MYSYSHVAQKIQTLVDHVARLPAMDGLPEKPKDFIPADMRLVSAASKAMQELPESDPAKSSQFFGDALQEEILGLRRLYAKTVQDLGSKANIPVKALLKSVVPGVDLNSVDATRSQTVSAPKMAATAA